MPRIRPLAVMVPPGRRVLCPAVYHRLREEFGNVRIANRGVGFIGEESGSRP